MEAKFENGANGNVLCPNNFTFFVRFILYRYDKYGNRVCWCWGGGVFNYIDTDFKFDIIIFFLFCIRRK